MKGAECKCSPVRGFESELTDDSLCNIPCPVKDFDPGRSLVSEEIKNPCGGNRGYSVYCSSGQESCSDLVRDVERQHKAQENSKNVLVPSSNNRNSGSVTLLHHPCTKCNYSLNNFCKSPHILPSNDYFPTNSPETCVEYCGSSVIYLMRGIGDKERLPTKYALLTWWHDGQADWPICSCINEEERQLLSDVDDPVACNVPCPGNPSEICGDKEQGTVIFGTVYCVDNSNCSPFVKATTTTSKSNSIPPIDPCTDDEIDCEEEPPPDSGSTEPPPESIITESEEPSTTEMDITTVEAIETTWETTTKQVTTSTTPSSTPTPITLTSTPTPTTTSTPKPTTPIMVCRKKCQSHDRRGHYWEACVGQKAIVRCVDLHRNSNSTGLAFWYCSENGEFETPNPDVSNCTSVWLGEKQEEIKNISDIVSRNEIFSEFLAFG